MDVGDYERACQLLEIAIRKIPDDAIDKRFGLLAAASVACRATLARSLGELGRFDEAIQVGDEAIRIADEVGHAFSQLYALMHAAAVLLIKGGFEQSLPLLERSLELCESTRSKLLVPQVASSLGYAYVRTDQVSRGLALMEEAATRADRQRDFGTHCRQFLRLAEAYLSAGQTDKAIGCASSALESAKQNGEKGHEAWALWTLGEIHTNAIEALDPLAERCGREAQTIAVARHMVPLAAHCQMSLGKIFGRQGASKSARSELDAAIACYRKLGMGYWLELAEAEAKRKEPAGLLRLPEAVGTPSDNAPFWIVLAGGWIFLTNL